VRNFGLDSGHEIEKDSPQEVKLWRPVLLETIQIYASALKGASIPDWLVVMRSNQAARAK
jgi:hypothetical protein